jgi:hypothetical protein
VKTSSPRYIDDDRKCSRGLTVWDIGLIPTRGRSSDTQLFAGVRQAWIELEPEPEPTIPVHQAYEKWAFLSTFIALVWSAASRGLTIWDIGLILTRGRSSYSQLSAGVRGQAQIELWPEPESLAHRAKDGRVGARHSSVWRPLMATSFEISSYFQREGVA